MQKDVPPQPRRTPPRTRFAGAEHLFNLDAEAERLSSETDGAGRGHRQITLFSGDGVSIVLFDLDAGGSLTEHAADGYVTVHVLSGEIEVATAEHHHRMPAGSLLVFRPGVRHDVQAETASRLLLTVSMQRADGDPA